MAEATARTARISLKDVRASVKRMQTEGERLVGRIRRDAQSLISRTRREAVTDLLVDARKFEQAIRKRAESTIQISRRVAHASSPRSRSRRAAWSRRSSSASIS